MIYTSRAPSPEDSLALDLDLRLHDVLLDALARRDWHEEILAAFLRLAYGAGYCDALTEPQRGQLCRDHGFPVPRRGAVRKC